MNARELTDKEAARELFSAGYLQALEDVGRVFKGPRNAEFLEMLRNKVASVKMRAAIVKAAGK